MNNKLAFFIIFAFPIVFFAQVSYGQTEDFQNWNSISVKKKINDNTSLIFEQEIRLQDNASRFKDYITVLGGRYSISKYVKFQGLYRHTLSYDPEDGQENEHRWYADVYFKYKYERLKFGYRARYQLNYQQFNVNTWHHLRNKLTVKYDLPKSRIVPYAQYEFYYSLNNPIQNSIDKAKYTLGLDYALFDYMSVGAFYRLQYRHEYGRNPANRYILGIGIEFEI
ncbi:MAG: DUF2490 domain-containing protein [Salinivirgaceae bacterium]|jgi:hypothetical protein|nr:DUF2490 domain-containing protein [Salinivirgaceae bacterium]